MILPHFFISIFNINNMYLYTYNLINSRFINTHTKKKKKKNLIYNFHIFYFFIIVSKVLNEKNHIFNFTLKLTSNYYNSITNLKTHKPNLITN